MTEDSDGDLSFHPVAGTLLSLPLFALLIAAGLWPYEALHGTEALSIALDRTGGVGFLAVFAGGIVIHELLHGWGWSLAPGVSRADVSYGFQWKTLTPYAHLETALPARSYRVGTAMPGLVLGVAPVLLGTALQWPVVAGYGAVLLSLACGDLLILLRIWRLPADALVRDHPVRFGAELAAD
jgi:hypothetical protein